MQKAKIRSPWGIALAVLAAAACGPKSGGNPGAGGADAGGGADQPGEVDAGTTGPSADAAPPIMEAAVYAHSSNQLFRVDPDTLETTLVGVFGWPDGPDMMTDIAIDKDGRMTGISYDRVYSVDKDTAECQYLADLDTSFNGLSWVPTDPADPNSPEILVGAALNGDVYQVDPDTGATTLLGSYGNGLGSSGDIVSVRGLGTIATVTSDADTDQLASIDPMTWNATIIGDTGELDIWGLGFWGDKVYGFTDTRKFVLIDVDTGAATEIQGGSQRWWGAGVTTSAPVID